MGRCVRCTGGMLSTIGLLVVIVAGAAAIIWGAETFAEHLAAASRRLGVTSFALALLLAGAEPEELATVVTASARGVDGVAFGDVIGANATVVTLALGVGAFITALPFGKRIRRYAVGGLLTGVLATALSWDGSVGRLEGGILVLAYVIFVAVIWQRERQPPPLGETGELYDDDDDSESGNRDLLIAIVGVISLTLGSIAIVEAVRRLADAEAGQTRLGITLVGFATGFELVVLAWSAARHGVHEAVIAGVVGSFAYNMTMSLGLGAIAAPVAIDDASLLHRPLIAMLLLLALVIGLSVRADRLGRREAWILLAGYPAFILVSLV